MATNGTQNSRTERANSTREQILSAAIAVFSEHGFEGTTLSDVALRSNAKVPLIVYHYENKESLWRAAVDAIWERVQGAIASKANESMPELDGTTESAALNKKRLKSVLRAIIEGVAEYPEYLRMLVREASHPGPRFDWLSEHHLKRDYQAAYALIQAAQKNKLAPDIDPAHLVYILAGALYLPVMMEADVERQTGKSPRAEAFLNTHTEAVISLLFSG